MGLKPKILFVSCVKDKQLERKLCKIGSRKNDKNPNFGDLFFDSLEENIF